MTDRILLKAYDTEQQNCLVTASLLKQRRYLASRNAWKTANNSCTTLGRGPKENQKLIMASGAQGLK